MIRSMIVGLALLGLASAVMAESEEVVIVPRAQYYHRPGHMTVYVTKTVTIEQAIANGYTACFECTPPKVVDEKLRDNGPSPYFRQLLAGKTITDKVPGRLPKTSEIEAKATQEQTQQQQTAALAAAINPAAAAAAPAPAPAPRPVAAATTPSTPPPGQVPGTGGLLQALQFQNNGLVPTDVNYQGQAITK